MLKLQEFFEVLTLPIVIGFILLLMASVIFVALPILIVHTILNERELRLQEERYQANMRWKKMSYEEKYDERGRLRHHKQPCPCPHCA